MWDPLHFRGSNLLARRLTLAPHVRKMTVGDLPFEQRTINLCHGEHPSNVAEMFIAAALAVKFQFVQDHILRRGQPQLRFTNVNGPAIAQRPAVERIIGAEINIGLITALKMDDIEMSAPVARPFDFHDITRWSIKFILRKDALQGGNGFARMIMSMSCVTRISP